MTATAFPFRRAFATSATSADFTAKIPLAATAKPSGVGVFDILSTSLGYAKDTYVPQYLQIQPFGTDANDETFSMRLWGWSKIHNLGSTPGTPAADHGVWVPQLILQLDCVLGNIAATAIEAGAFLVDTITVVDGDADVAVISPANDTPGHILVHYRACELIEFDVDIGTGGAANALWRPVDHP